MATSLTSQDAHLNTFRWIERQRETAYKKSQIGREKERDISQITILRRVHTRGFYSISYPILLNIKYLFSYLLRASAYRVKRNRWNAPITQHNRIQRTSRCKDFFKNNNNYFLHDFATHILALNKLFKYLFIDRRFSPNKRNKFYYVRVTTDKRLLFDLKVFIQMNY